MVVTTDAVSTSSSKADTTSKTVSSTSTKASSTSTKASSSSTSTASTSSTSSSAPSSTLSSAASTSSTSSATSTSTATSQCYVMLSNAISTTNWVPCGSTNTTTPNVPCCASGDYCLADGLCHYTHSANGGSGYYAAGCTDRTWKDTAACAHLCDDRVLRDVVWNGTSSLWNCCGANAANGNPQCEAPTDETFNAPAPSALQTYYVAGAAATRAATHSATARAHAGLSAGAAAGIGVVCGIAGVAVLGGLAYMVWRRRRAARGLGGAVAPYKYAAAEMATDANTWPPAELASAGAPPGSGGEPKAERAVQSEPVELSAEPVVRGRSDGAGAVERSAAESGEGERPGSDADAAVSPVSSSGGRRPDLPDSLRIGVLGSS